MCEANGSQDHEEILYGLNDPETVSRVFLRNLMNVCNTRERKDLTLAHSGGSIVCDDNYIISVRGILFDTGALTSNFISKDLFETFRNHVCENKVIKKETVIGFADKTSRMKCSFVVKLKLRFEREDSKGEFVLYDGDFIVADMGSNDIIIGLPAIVKDLWDYFLFMLKGRTIERIESEVSFIKRREDDVTEDDLLLNAVEELLQPWCDSSREVAPEELDVPDPSQFGFASSFLGKTREEALSEFEDMFGEHVSPEFSAARPVLELLRTKGVEVFVPERWEGIKGVDPLNIKFAENLPPRIKPKARPVNPRLYEDAEKEFRRLCGYIYVPSRSPWASCLVIAPKATKPFIRICGDYVQINKYIPSPHYTVPNVRHELDRIIGYKIFMDIDLTNAFHQIRLHENTSEKLSVQTPWGQFQPLFLPEGVSPGISVLQEAVVKLFGDLEWALCIFDNVLLLAHDFDDAYKKLEIFLDRCIEHGVVLKFAKTWLGFREIKFFGYLVRHNSFELTDDRKEALLKIPFPENGNRCKKIRSLLGLGVFFAPFVQNYSDLVKHLTDMTKSSFNWEETTWQHDYRQEFENYKSGLQQSCALFYPNYDLEWTLRTDASDYGVAGILFQTVEGTGSSPIQQQTIAICSKKLSEQALKWCTIEKEGFGIFYSVKKFSFYLRGKKFTIETDHNNLVWMEASEVAKIIRWRIYLQDFDFLIRHIPGKNNVVADCLSRLLYLSGFVDESDDFDSDEVNFVTLHNIFEKDDFEDDVQEIAPPTEVQRIDYYQAIKEVHNAQAGHWGAKETWKRLCRQFPGHGVPFKVVADFVDECINCQKNRRELKQRLIPITRHLKPPHSRSALGIDAVAITPVSKSGYTHIVVMVNLFTKLVYLYAVKGMTAINLATAVWKCWCTYGLTDMIISDMGPDLKSELFAELVKLSGLRHVFSIANRHVNGCERIIKEVVRHIRAICFDKRIEADAVLEDELLLATIMFILNTHESSETGYSAFELTFGSQDSIYKNLLAAQGRDNDPSHQLLKRLNDYLALVRQISADYQKSLVEKRAEAGLDPAKQNQYCPGDFVMFDAGAKPHPKLSSRMKGPFEVVRQYKNDVQIRNLLTGGIREYSVSDLEPFFGDKESAIEAAMRDHEQFKVEEILSYTGDSRTKSTMVFKVKYADGDILDIPWTPDIQCEAYYDFCESRPYLRHLAYDSFTAKRFISSMRKENITTVSVGDTVYVDLRFYGDLWYESLGLPDYATAAYVMEFTYTHWYHKNSKRKISARFNLNGSNYAFDNYLVYCWGSQKDFDPARMILVDASLAAAYPKIIQE